MISGASDVSVKPYPPVGFTSAIMPLLTKLHERLNEYEDAVAHAYAIREKYGDTRGHIEPPSGEMHARITRTNEAFEAVLQHVDVVDQHLDDDYVLLHRDACGPTNSLYRAPPSASEDYDTARTVRTRSPILSNAAQLDVSFRPYPCAEVLLRSPILANSRELKLLASGPPV